MITCKCGHSINLHNHNGCQHIDRPNEMDLVCKCWLTPEVIAESKLATLAALLREVREEYRDYRIITGRLQSKVDNMLDEVEAWASVNEMNKPLPHEVYKDFEQGQPFKDER